MAEMIRPRLDFVLVRIVERGHTTKGIAVASKSQEGKRYYVDAIGPDVEDIKVGDRILMNGANGTDWGYLPNDPQYIIIRQSNIPLVYEEIPEILPEEPKHTVSLEGGPLHGRSATFAGEDYYVPVEKNGVVGGVMHYKKNTLSNTATWQQPSDEAFKAWKEKHR